MSKISKGTRTFGIYFIVYACSMFLARVTSLLYHLIENLTLASNASRHRQAASEVFLYTTFDAVVDFIGLGLAIFVFFAAMRILKLSKLALASVNITCVVGVGYNVAAIIKDVMKVLYHANNIGWRSYQIAGGIAMCLLSICFWCFVFYFFNRASIKKQFGVS